MICPLSVDEIFNRFGNQQLLLSYKVEEEYATVQLPPLNDVCQNICLPVKREMNGKPTLLTPECYKSAYPILPLPPRQAPLASFSPISSRNKSSQD